MNRVIADIEQITAAWLTDVLRTSGNLPDGQVLHFNYDVEAGYHAQHVKLQVQYSNGAEAPTSFHLKMADCGSYEHDGEKEVYFYKHVGPQLPTDALVPCFDAAYDPQTGKYHLLLEDLSASHDQPRWPNPPTAVQCLEAAEAVAAIHAVWWGQDHFAGPFRSLPAESMDDTRTWAERVLPEFLDSNDSLTDQQRAIFDLYLHGFDAISRRLLSGQHLTLSHRDAHFWNFLFPRSKQDTVRLLDWEAWRVDMGSNDLASMFALCCPPEFRRQHELKCLKRYHDRLLGSGVCGYSWDEFYDDYRLSVVRGILIPVERWSRSLSARVWHDNLQKILHAFQDLHCADLLAT